MLGGSSTGPGSCIWDWEVVTWLREGGSRAREVVTWLREGVSRARVIVTWVREGVSRARGF